MNTQRYLHAALASPGSACETLPRRPDRCLSASAAAGVSRSSHGRVWLTRAGDLDDHVVESGESFDGPGVGADAWSRPGTTARPALIAWQPTHAASSASARALRAVFGRCWDIVDPARRIGVGSVGGGRSRCSRAALLFGPLSEARDARAARAAGGAFCTIAPAPARIGADAGTRTGPSTDVSADARDRARVAAQEARRRAPGAA